VVLTALNSFSRQSFLVSTNETNALEVFLNGMHYINSHFTLLCNFVMFALFKFVEWFSLI